jgi:hypothetical protein
MKKNKIKVFILISLIFISLTSAYYIITHKRGHLIGEEKIEEYYQFLCPMGDTYSICVLKDNKVIPVTEQKFLNCGDKVSVVFKLDFTDENYILCLNRDKLVGGNSEAPGAYNYDNGSKIFSCNFPVPSRSVNYEWGVIPKREGIFKFAEIYAFPKNLNMKEKELLENLSLGKKILSIEKEIKCP